MTLSRRPGTGHPDVLRDVALNAAPRVLTRRPTGSAAPAQTVSEAPQQQGYVDETPNAEFADGYEAGFTQGLTAGAAEGRQQGVVQGTAQGFEEGFAKGHADGHAAGEREGRDAGFAAGMQEARAQVDAQQAQWQEHASALVAQLQGERAAMREAAESDIVELVMTAICRIAGEGAINRDGARAMIRNAMQQASPARVMRVRVNPDDFGWLNAGAVPGDPVWLADSAVGLGGCIVETDAGTLDARLETQLEAVKNALRDVRAARAAGAAAGGRATQGPSHA
ncbi:FliH/SctL family protein [Pandoraea bronchicola]|uniref:Flagellar assembly protein FliH n=1 Tax=Pandoraea bronchicola TaxID=2508287 RepID=A0A5E5C0D5_9BURK|nr:FliH/SctL family protein [Pandoraea bronchicola]VVE90695.1 Yop proteins translocation protein L [Pandoraea bronchicola]